MSFEFFYIVGSLLTICAFLSGIFALVNLGQSKDQEHDEKDRKLAKKFFVAAIILGLLAYWSIHEGQQIEKTNIAQKSEEYLKNK